MMKIISHNQHIKTSKNGNTCLVSVLHVKISDVSERAQEMIDTISNTSWINHLEVVDQVSYTTRAERTIKKLADEIFAKVSSPISTQFGEYMVSMTAQDALEKSAEHNKLPLAELFKEKVLGNPGFDFHTETSTTYIAFGEAKYSGRKTPYEKAIIQINSFVQLGKDRAELTDLKHFCSKQAIDNALDGMKAYVAAFSINVKNVNRMFSKLLASEEITPLLEYPELYLIGVEVSDC